MRSIAFICTQIKCVVNSTQFQHASYLCDNYRVYIFSTGPVCDEVVSKAQQVKCWRASVFAFAKALSSLWLFFQVWTLHRREKVDLVVTTPHSQPLITGYLLKKVGLPWVADIWDDPRLSADVESISAVPHRLIRSAYNRLLLWVVERVLRHTDLIIVSLYPDILRQYRIDPDAHNVLALTNGVDLQETQPMMVQGNRPFSAIYVGWIHKVRGSDLLIEAAQLVREELSDFSLALIGPVTREDKARLIRSINGNGLHGAVQIVDQVDHKEALRKIADSDVCLCTLSPTIRNYRYAYPIKVFEYMAMGKAVVCTRLDGTQRIIQDGKTGLLIAPESPKAVADAILRLYHDQALRKKIGENARQVVTQYDWKLITIRIGARLDQLLAAKVTL